MLRLWSRPPLRAHLRPVATFCYVWLMVGFFTGTLVLLGPVRWMTTAIRARRWEQGNEDLAVQAVIVLYVIGSALIAGWLVRRINGCRTRRARMAIPLSVTMAAALCLWAWMNPTRLAGAATMGTVNLANGAEFVFGPYPDRPHLERLKQQGFTAVISLQHPAVVPFEPPGIAAEIEAAKAVGLQFIHAPMLPWISKNDDALQRIRQIAAKGEGRYYVHCGLGRDRANVVKRMLELEGAPVKAEHGFTPPTTFADRINTPMERGRVWEVEQDLWLVPYPNKHEFFGNMLSGQVRHVTLVLDADDPTQAQWIAEARELLTEFAVPFRVAAPPNGDTRLALDLIRAARQAARPSVVVVPFTRPSSRKVADDLLTAFEIEAE
jgi:protein tyrosine phosphatase (PTP) superfamily phosphohydrolase (DUF442 family)